jgi:hypothetical protein
MQGMTLTEVLATVLPTEAEKCDAIVHFVNGAILNVISAAVRSRIAPVSVCGIIGQHGKT